MPALNDPKLEAFAQALLRNIAAFMPRSKAAEQAARTAGYTGKSLGSNARKRAQRKDVKARMLELAAPKTQEAEAQIAATLDGAKSKLWSIASVDLGTDAIRVSDQIAALKQLCEMNPGWKAPEKRDVTVRSADELTDDELAAIAAGGGEETPGT